MSETWGMGVELAAGPEMAECQLPKGPEVGMRFKTKMYGMQVTFEIMEVVDGQITKLQFIECVNER